MTVSAVVVGHGSRELLDKALIQLHAQTKVPDEIIICCCCTDLTGVLAEIIVSDIHRGDWGHLARDVGLRLATQERLIFVNSDDEYDPTFIENLSSHPEQLVYCDFETHTAARVIESYPSIGAITSGNFIVDTELAQRIGWNDRDYIADGQFIMDIMETHPSHVRVPEVLYFHR